jgi:inosine/xanthosine triphosphate pyrophosphatase family protein
MAQKVINIGTSVNSGGGDALRDAMIKINDNFTELYADIVALEDGQIDTDIKGSVFADDSTLLVDAVNGIIPGYVSLTTLQTEAAAAADFADFQARIAAL